MFFLMAIVDAVVRPGRDAELVARVAAGDRRALEELYEAHAPAAMALARRVLRSHEEAEDVVQESFLELWRRAGQYERSRGGVRAWLLTITRTRAIDRLRTRASAQRTASEAAVQPEPAPPPFPLELASQRQERERIAAALSQLPAEQRTALELVYFEGLTQSEVATRTEAPVGTVKTRLRLALEKLAVALAGELGS